MIKPNLLNRISTKAEKWYFRFDVIALLFVKERYHTVAERNEVFIVRDV